MKKLISLLLCIGLILGLVTLSGCGLGISKELSGTEVAKMLLANSRLNPADLDLGLETALTGAPTSVAMVDAPDFSLLSSSQSGNVVQWKDFSDGSNTYEFFQSYFVNIENTANVFAQEITAVKETCGNTNYWMKRTGSSEQFLLEVKANEDIIFIKDNDRLRICRRYTNENADDVYDMYSKNLDGSYEERCLYIAGKRYEFANNFGGYEGIYIVAENSKGYWNMFQVTDIEKERANVMNFVSDGTVAYTFDNSIFPNPPEEQEPTIRFSTPDLKNDVITFGPRMVELNISAFSGVSHIESASSEVNFLGDGSNALTSQQGTVVTKAGKRISTSDSFADGKIRVGGVIASFTKDFYGPGKDSTVGTLSLWVEGETTVEQINNLKQFLQEVGLTCRYNLDSVLSGLSQATAYAKAFPTTYTWNGYSVDKYDGIEKAVSKERDRLAAFLAMYEDVKNMKTVSVSTFGASFDNWDFSPIAAISGESVTLANNTITVNNLSVTVENTTLFDSGSAYTVCLALAKFTDESESAYDNAVLLACEGADVTTFTDGNITLHQTATFEIPQCTSGGQYTIVAYVATEDGIRVSEMVPLVFTEDISAEVTYEDITTIFATNTNRELRITCVVAADVYKKPEEESLGVVVTKVANQYLKDI